MRGQNPVTAIAVTGLFIALCSPSGPPKSAEHEATTDIADSTVVEAALRNQPSLAERSYSPYVGRDFPNKVLNLWR
jgi:hypothetical protein